MYKILSVSSENGRTGMGSVIRPSSGMCITHVYEKNQNIFPPSKQHLPRTRIFHLLTASQISEMTQWPCTIFYIIIDVSSNIVMKRTLKILVCGRVHPSRVGISMTRKNFESKSNYFLWNSGKFRNVLLDNGMSMRISEWLDNSGY